MALAEEAPVPQVAEADAAQVADAGTPDGADPVAPPVSKSWNDVTMTVTNAKSTVVYRQPINPGTSFICGVADDVEGSATVTLLSSVDIPEDILIDANADSTVIEDPDGVGPSTVGTAVHGLVAGVPVTVTVPIGLTTWGFLREVTVTATAPTSDIAPADGLVVTAPNDLTLKTIYTAPLPISTLNLGSTTGVVGQEVIFEVSYFKPNEKVDVTLNSDPIHLTTVTADAEGAIFGAFVVPASAVVGDHTVVFTGQESAISTGAAFSVAETPVISAVPEVIPAPGAAAPHAVLAETGADGSLAIVGSLILAAGLAVMAVRRRAARSHR